jgi:hypothetical protein
LFRISSIVETETNRQLLIKLKKPENGQLITNTNSMTTEYLINEQQNCSTINEISSTNGHHNTNQISQQIPTSSADQTTET